MSVALSERLREAVTIARMAGASDLHLASGARPVIRIDGAIRRTAAAEITVSDLREAIRGGFPAYAVDAFERDGSASAAIEGKEAGALRLHAYKAQDGLALAVRLLPDGVPAFDATRLPSRTAEFGDASAGLVLFCGPTGCGKTTSMAALVDRINRSSARLIVTIEDPIEYRHAGIKSMVLQREVGPDVPSFEDGVISALRCDPDAIVLGELRSPATMQVALRAAETGHLVLSTLHAPDTARALSRIVGAFAPERQSAVRSELADVLVGVIAQRLIRRTGGGRTCAAEVLVASDGVRSLIRDGKFHQIRNAIALGRNAGMQTLEDDLRRLVARGEVALADARVQACRPQELSGLEDRE